MVARLRQRDVDVEVDVRAAGAADPLDLDPRRAVGGQQREELVVLAARRRGRRPRHLGPEVRGPLEAVLPAVEERPHPAHGHASIIEAGTRHRRPARGPRPRLLPGPDGGGPPGCSHAPAARRTGAGARAPATAAVYERQEATRAPDWTGGASRQPCRRREPGTAARPARGTAGARQRRVRRPPRPHHLGHPARTPGRRGRRVGVAPRRGRVGLGDAALGDPAHGGRRAWSSPG